MKNSTWTVLNVTSGLFITIIFFYTLINYDELSSSEGWGIVGMFGLLGLGLLGLFVDYVLRALIRDRKRLNIVEIITLIIFVGYIMLNSLTNN